MHSKELHVRVFHGLISFLLSPLLFIGNAGISTAWAQEAASVAGAAEAAGSGATVHSGKVQLENETVGLTKPKSKNAFGKVVYREGTVKVDNKDAPAGSEIKAGSLLEAGADGRALIVLKKKSRQAARFNPEDLLGLPKKPKKKVKASNVTRVLPKPKPAAQKNNAAAQPKKPRKKQMGLSKGIDVRRLQYIALVGDAQAKMTDNEIAIETKDGEAIITQGTSRILNLGPNSKMRVPAQPQSGITGTLCHGTLTGVAKPSTNANGPNIETSSGIVNFPSGGRFLVEAAGSGPIQECDKEKKSNTPSEKSGGIRVVSLDAPGRLILAHRPPPAPVVLPKFKRQEEKQPSKGGTPSPKDKPMSFSLAGEDPYNGSGFGGGGGGGLKSPEKGPQTVRKDDSWKPVQESDPKDEKKEQKTVSNLTDDTDRAKRPEEGAEKKTNEPEREKKTSGGEGGGDKKTADKPTDEKQKNTGGKPPKPEDSPLDIDQGKGNDKFISSDSPASKGADKRIALNDEKQHDGEDTRQPGTPAKEEKPPQSSKTEDSNPKTRDSDKEKPASNLTADNEPEREKKTSGGDGGGDKKTADKPTDEKQKNTGGKPTKPEDSPLDIDQGKGNDKFIGSDSPASKGADKRIALNDEKQHDGEDTRQPGTPAKEEKPPQSSKTEDSNPKTRDSDKEKPASNLTADNEPEREKKTSGGDGGGDKKTADKPTDEKQKNTGGKPPKPEDSPLDIDQGKGNDKFIGSDSPASKGADKRIALNDEKQHDGEDTRQPATPGKEEKPPQSSGGDSEKNVSGIKQNSEGIFEFAPLQDVKAPELPDMRNMNEKEKKEVYSLIAANTESAPASKSLLTNLVNQIPTDIAIALQKPDQGGFERKAEPVRQNSNNEQDSSSEKPIIKGSANKDKNADESKVQDSSSRKVENQDLVEKPEKGQEKNEENDQDQKISESAKNKRMPLIQPPKMSPPPPPKIETTQMPLSSDVLIKLRKKVK